MKVAIPTKGKDGLEDSVADVFGKTGNFVIIDVDVENGSIVAAKVVENPAASYKHGAGPITVKMLTDIGVDAVAGSEFGLGVTTILEQNKIKRFRVKAGMSVRKALENILKKTV